MTTKRVAIAVTKPRDQCFISPEMNAKTDPMPMLQSTMNASTPLPLRSRDHSPALNLCRLQISYATATASFSNHPIDFHLDEIIKTFKEGIGGEERVRPWLSWPSIGQTQT